MNYITYVNIKYFLIRLIKPSFCLYWHVVLLETGDVIVALSWVVFLSANRSDLSWMIWILPPSSLPDLSSLGSSLMMMGEQQTQRPDTAFIRACTFGNQRF